MKVPEHRQEAARWIEPSPQCGRRPSVAPHTSPVADSADKAPSTPEAAEAADTKGDGVTGVKKGAHGAFTFHGW
jgi:hypothetical protein